MLARQACFGLCSRTLDSGLPSLAPPAPREAHFWCLFPDEVCESSLLKLYRGFLCPEEQKQILKEKTEKLQKERLLTRVLARTLLSRYTGGLVKPSSLKFEKNTYGKPEVSWPKMTISGETWPLPKLHFNLSNTRSLIGCCVTNNSLVGIDIEEKGRALRRDPLAFARCKFSQTEAAWLEQFSDLDEQHHHFMKLWTLKEAYLKALGNGIGGTSLRDFAFRLKASPAINILLEKATQLPACEQACTITLEILNSKPHYSNTWQFFLFQPTDFHYASICVENCKRIDQEGHADMSGFNFQVMKTIPLVGEECLSGTALGLGLSM